jgi:hypothetical protein
MKYTSMLVAIFATTCSFAQKGFEIKQDPTEKRVEVMYNGFLLTAYQYADSLFKPVLYPIYSTGDVRITRDYPLVITPGERGDHPHHIGLFMTHQSVNGFDFWNMSTNIKPKDRPRYGHIEHVSVKEAKGDKKGAKLVTEANWKSNDGQQQLAETTTFLFKVSKNDFVIDRVTTLTANNKDVVFKDMKDAFLGIRLARELEQPSDVKDRMVQVDGSLGEPQLSKDGPTGLYRNSEGVTGDATWGKRARWMCMDGTKNGKQLTIAILDHPKNIEYPSYWHARGYGLFAVNPLGKEVFSEDKTPLNLTLKKGESVTFRYRIIIHEGTPLTAAAIDAAAKEMEKALR